MRKFEENVMDKFNELLQKTCNALELNELKTNATVRFVQN
jgi:hypothetical protein